MKRISSLFFKPSFVSSVGIVPGVLATALAASTWTLGGCASFDRSQASGYAGRYEELNFGRDRREAELEASRAELGLLSSRSLNDEEAEAIEDRIALRKAEKTIEGRQERELYFKNKPYMRNDRERLQFLSLGSMEARERWLTARGIHGNSTAHPPEIQALIEINDITIGMTSQAVKDSWGEPELVEVAGNPIYGNERWHYSEQTSSTEGYQTERRMVYFESGRVVGWEKR